MNTKISTLGTAMSAMKNEEVQVCYAEVQQYNYHNYSIPKDYYYLFQLDELVRTDQER